MRIIHKGTVVIPTRVSDGQRFVIEPAFRFHGFLINNFKWSIVIPVLGLRYKLTCD